MRAALDLFLDGEALMRQNLRRRRPQASAAEIEQALVAWARWEPGGRGRDLGAALDGLTNG